MPKKDIMHEEHDHCMKDNTKQSFFMDMPCGYYGNLDFIIRNVFSLEFQIAPLASLLVNQCRGHSLRWQHQAWESNCWRCRGCQIKCEAQKTNLLLNRFLSSTDHFSDALQTPFSPAYDTFLQKQFFSTPSCQHLNQVIIIQGTGLQAVEWHEKTVVSMHTHFFSFYNEEIAYRHP